MQLNKIKHTNKFNHEAAEYAGGNRGSPGRDPDAPGIELGLKGSASIGPKLCAPGLTRCRRFSENAMLEGSLMLASPLVRIVFLSLDVNISG